MSLIDPTVKDARREKMSGKSLAVRGIFHFISALVGAFLIARGLGFVAELSGPVMAAHQIGGFVVFAIGFTSMVVGAAAIMHIKGAFAIMMAVQAAGMGAGVWLAFGGQLPIGARIPVLVLLGLAALSLLAGWRALASQRRRERLVAELEPHVAVMHDQSYTDATWEEYSGSMGVVTLKFIDRDGQERFVRRSLTQYRDSPIPNGTPVTMCWDSAAPDQVNRMIFTREIHGRLEYF